MTDGMTFPNVYPGAGSLLHLGALASGKMMNLPLGVTVHYLAERDPDKAISSLMRNKLGYHGIIDREGVFIQTSGFDNVVNHAGVAKWNYISPNKRHLAIALSSWGQLTKVHGNDQYVSWAGSTVPLVDVVLRRGNIDSALHYWDKATDRQEDTLRKFLEWAVSQGIRACDICGHDECAIPQGRKNDPGGVLSMMMSELRSTLNKI